MKIFRSVVVNVLIFSVLCFWAKVKFFALFLWKAFDGVLLEGVGELLPVSVCFIFAFVAWVVALACDKCRSELFSVANV